MDQALPGDGSAPEVRLAGSWALSASVISYIEEIKEKERGEEDCCKHHHLSLPSAREHRFQQKVKKWW
jgi:hypothetical protein